MKDKVFFSAKDLVSRSCKQLKFFIENPDAKPKPTDAQYDGIDYQHQIALSIDGLIGEEMGNYIEFDNIRVYFSNDIVTPSEIIEVKNIDKNRPVEEYYRNNSILQTAMYCALTWECNRFLRTSAFHVNSGHEYKTTIVDSRFEYKLYFGDEKYLILITNREKLIYFLKTKALYCLDWNKAKEFDAKYKRREFEVLKDCFEYKKIG